MYLEAVTDFARKQAAIYGVLEAEKFEVFQYFVTISNLADCSIDEFMVLFSDSPHIKILGIGEEQNWYLEVKVENGFGTFVSSFLSIGIHIFHLMTINLD